MDMHAVLEMSVVALVVLSCAGVIHPRYPSIEVLRRRA